MTIEDCLHRSLLRSLRARRARSRGTDPTELVRLIDEALATMSESIGITACRASLRARLVDALVTKRASRATKPDS